MLKRRVAKSRVGLKRLTSRDRSRSKGENEGGRIGRDDAVANSNSKNNRDKKNPSPPPLPPPVRRSRSRSASESRGRSGDNKRQESSQSHQEQQQQGAAQVEQQTRSSQPQQQQQADDARGDPNPNSNRSTPLAPSHHQKWQQARQISSRSTTPTSSGEGSRTTKTPVDSNQQQGQQQQRGRQQRHSGMAGSTSVEDKLVAVQRVYGPSANIYTDVLKVSPAATPGEIREAFFCLRYDIHEKLDAPAASAGALTSDERREVEAQMDAITGAFHVLSDGERRKAYDATLISNNEDNSNNDTSLDTAEMDGMGFPVAAGGIGGSRARARAPHSPSKLSPSKADKNSAHLPIGLRRSVFRHRAALRSSGMNESRRPVATPVTGGLNSRTRPTVAAHTPSESQDSIFSSVGPGGLSGNSSGRKSPRWTDIGNNGMVSSMMPGDKEEMQQDNNNGAHKSSNTNAGGGRGAQQQDNEALLLAGVNNLNAREKMLYKNQMYLSQQKQQQQSSMQTNHVQGSSRLGSRYDAMHGERGDKYTDEDHTPPLGSSLTSPTGVDGFDHSNSKAWSRKVKHGQHGESRRPSPETMTDSNMTEDDDTSLNRMREDTSAAVTPVASKTEDDDDDDTATRASSIYDDDTQTYDDNMSYADETTTLGETVDDTTIGDSTWASYDDDATSYATGNTREEESGGKFSPGHKKGKTPAPILKSGLNKGAKKRSDSGESKRVTIHSHRGRGEETDDFSLFEGAMCPTIPSLTAISEEVNGTYKDILTSLHQVSNAFVISPDDIDRMADKIRDAKIELGENYAKQVKERQPGNDKQGISRGGGGGGGGVAGAGGGGQKNQSKNKGGGRGQHQRASSSAKRTLST
eukprot:CAMPEP_0181086924 /NCGR_PEP_ID=MMETSP1071-20121207/6006_1 /TAXON_ID=35127 /ORGANISM="Thalassiosira sp., Strain NH16" /LENGTH=861 /DNA_ID=CAMNT_0023168793 /DNA_START=269 /DNA_END=2857 /DNA_ORIENTATION=+